MSDDKGLTKEAEEWGRSLQPDEELKRGRAHLQAKKDAAKKRASVSVKLEQDVLEGLKHMMEPEGSYQDLANRALRQWLQGQQLEHVVRRVVREELEASAKKSA